MAIRQCWSFDDTQVLADRGLSSGGQGASSIATTAPRNGAQSLKIPGAGTPSTVIFPTGGFAVGDTIGFAMAYRPSWTISAPGQTPAGSTTYFVANFVDGGGTSHCRVGLGADGKVQAWLASGVQTGADVTPCAINVYSHWEIKFVCDDTTGGSIVVNINGVEYLDVPGIDTRNGGTGAISTIVVGTQDGSAAYSYADDCVLWDDTGSDVTDFVGDVAVLYRKASGAGNYAAWTPSTGANYENTDDLGTRDEDSTYNSSSTGSQKDSFALDDVAAGTVYAVQSVIRARKDDAGSRSVQPLFRIGGSDYVGASVSLSDGYVTFTEVFHNDPSDSGDWAYGDVNGAEHGYKLVA